MRRVLLVFTALISPVAAFAQSQSITSTVQITPDISPATVNITAIDSASSSATWANGQTVLSGSPTTNSVASFSVSTINGATIQVSGTWQGTLVTEGTVDGTNWTALPVRQRGTSYWVSSFAAASSGTTGDFIADVNAAGLKGVRVRATAWTSGTATVAFLQTANIPTLSETANIGSANGAPLDPCFGSVKSNAPISLTASGQVIAGTSGKKTYICAIHFSATTAGSAAIVEGTGTTCATNIYGLDGGTTAATGLPVGADGGYAFGSGAGTVLWGSADTNATAANVCLLLATTGQVSGAIEYVQAP